MHWPAMLLSLNRLMPMRPAPAWPLGPLLLILVVPTCLVRAMVGLPLPSGAVLLLKVDMA